MPQLNNGTSLSQRQRGASANKAALTLNLGGGIGINKPGSANTRSKNPRLAAMRSKIIQGGTASSDTVE